MPKEIKVKVEKDELVIRMPLIKPPVPSKKGKVLLVASSHGFHKTDVMLNQKSITIAVNAFIPKDA